jgi:hypothetical protein
VTGDQAPRQAMLADDALEVYAQMLKATSEVPLCEVCLVELARGEEVLCSDCAEVVPS